MCPRCSLVFDRKETKNIEGGQLAKNMRIWRDTDNRFAFDRRGYPGSKIKEDHDPVATNHPPSSLQMMPLRVRG